jgi:hypothetical protein
MARRVACIVVLFVLFNAASDARAPQTPPPRSSNFDVQKATIAQLQQAILKKQITTRGIVDAYLRASRRTTARASTNRKASSDRSPRKHTPDRSTRSRR